MSNLCVQDEDLDEITAFHFGMKCTGKGSDEVLALFVFNTD